MQVEEQRDMSFGVIPMRKTPEGLLFLIVQHTGGHWGFPKGHGEPRETLEQTAARELFEEVGLLVKEWVPGISFSETYTFHRHGRSIHKKNIYLPAFVEGVVRLQANEIIDHKWLRAEELALNATYEEMKRISQEIVLWTNQYRVHFMN